jgi:NAD(P)-dependent dehydrogenase (short-subunit alcohol dehydrogenase family)
MVCIQGSQIHEPKERQQLSKLKGKTALITGGNSGIGLATAKQFVAEGAYVYITGRRQKELDVAVAEIGKSVTAGQGDVADTADLDRLFAKIERERGRVDIVFANAAVATPFPLGKSRKNNLTESSMPTCVGCSPPCRGLSRILKVTGSY